MWLQRQLTAKTLLKADVCDPSVDIYEKVFGFFHIIFLDGVMDGSDAAAELSRLDGMLEICGGVSAYLESASQSARHSIQRHFLPPLYLLAEIPYQTYTRFRESTNDFLKQLQRICGHAQDICAQKLQPYAKCRKLWPLDLYLSQLIDIQLLTKDPSFIHRSGAFYHCYHICLTITLCNWSRNEASTYLQKLQDNFVMSLVPIQSPILPVQIIANAHSLFGMREDIIQLSSHRDVSDTCWKREFEIAQALVNGQKLFALMSKHVRSKVTRFLYQSAMSAGEDRHNDIDSVEIFLQALDSDLTESWYRDQKH